MEFILKRKLDVKKYIIIAETARFKEREDIVSVLKLADENGGKVTPKQICDVLLGEKPIRVGERIIFRCSELGLLSRDGELTQRGFVALKENRIPQPERAIYTIWFANDSLIQDEEKIIAIEQSRTRLGDELFVEDAEINSKLIDLPNILTENPDKFENLNLRGEKAKILKVENKGKEIKIPSKEQLFVEWEVKQYMNSILQLRGFRELKVKPPSISFKEVFRAVLGRNFKKWNDEYSCYKVNFESLTEKEVNTFQSVKEFNDPVIGDYGKFNTLKIPLKISPITQEDANKWANFLQKNNLTKYHTKNQFKDYQNQIASKFLEYDVELVPLRELISLLYREKNDEPKLCKNYWFLQAPLDLVLEGD